MRKTTTPIVLSGAEQETLGSWLRAGTSEQRMVERARIILAAADGVGTNDIARELQVEVWFSILSRRALVGASHTSPRQVAGGIDRFVAVYNETAAPFEWQQREVHRMNLSHDYADLRN